MNLHPKLDLRFLKFAKGGHVTLFIKYERIVKITII